MVSGYALPVRMWRHDSSERTSRDKTALERQTPPRRSSESASFDLEEHWLPKPFFAPAGPSRVVSPAEIAEVQRGEIVRVITVHGSAIFELEVLPNWQRRSVSPITPSKPVFS